MARSATARTPSECQVRPRVRVLCQLIAPSSARSRRAVTMTPRSPVTGTKRSRAMVAAMRSRNSSGSRPGSGQRHRAAPAAEQGPGEGGGLGVPFATLDLVPAEMGPLLLRHPRRGPPDCRPRNPPAPWPTRGSGPAGRESARGMRSRPRRPAGAARANGTTRPNRPPSCASRHCPPPRQALRWADACCGQMPRRVSSARASVRRTRFTEIPSARAVAA